MVPGKGGCFSFTKSAYLKTNAMLRDSTVDLHSSLQADSFISSSSCLLGCLSILEVLFSCVLRSQSEREQRSLVKWPHMAAKCCHISQRLHSGHTENSSFLTRLSPNTADWPWPEGGRVPGEATLLRGIIINYFLCS